MKKRVIDTHSDTLMKYNVDKIGFKEGDFDITFDKLSSYDSFIQTFAMFFNIQDGSKKMRKTAEEYLISFEHLLKNHNIKQILSARDLQDIDAQGGYGAILAIENACFFEDDEKQLDFYKNKGVKLLSMTHFLGSQYGCGNQAGTGTVQAKAKDLSYGAAQEMVVDSGLTARGKAMVGKVEARKIILDVSHLSFNSFADVCSVAKRPFMATHSNAFSICGHNRNIKDEMFVEMVKRGCLAGICFCPRFIDDGEVVTLDQALKHIEHFLSLGGENHICIGSDFDGISEKIVGLENASNTWALAELMRKNNYSETLIEKIMWNNAKEFLSKNM